jgi:methylenetetrahydrofolate reductase (NADPH)
MPKIEIRDASSLSADVLLKSQIAQFARDASVEINVQDEKHLAASCEFLRPATRVYVSHLPAQTWQATVSACAAVRRAGFEPIAHVPVRLLKSADELQGLLDNLRNLAQVDELLLISGDYPQSAGPFSAVAQVLAAGVLEASGFHRVSIAGHPEGHPHVELDPIRAAERDKVRLAREHGLQTTLVTQFLFEPTPYTQWVNEHVSQGVAAHFVCGLAGPAKISTLMRYAMRCGVGPSIRALGSHTSMVKNLLGDHGPDRMLRQLAQARVSGTCPVGGVHMFSFGGFLRTAQWLSRVASGDFRLRPDGGLDV